MNEQDLKLLNAVTNNAVLRVATIGKLIEKIQAVAFTEADVVVFEQMLTAEQVAEPLPDANENANRLALLALIEATLPLLKQIGDLCIAHAKRLTVKTK